MIAAWYKKIVEWLPYIFIAFLPIQLGKYFLFDFSYINGVPVDYLAVALFFTDLLFIALVALYRKTFRDIIKMHGSAFVILSIIIALSLSYAYAPLLALWKGLVLMECLSLYYFYCQQRINTGRLLTVLFFSVAVQLGLCIGQFISRGSLQGIFYFLGERYLRIDIPSIAKISFFGREYLRPYGTFSHPNSLGGFYGLTSVFLPMLKKRFSNKPLFVLTFCCSLFLVLLSFSRLAWFAVLVTLITYALLYYRKNFPFVVIILGIGSLLFLFVQGDPLSLSKRLEGTWSTLDLIVQKPFGGVGLGQHLYGLSTYPTRYPYFFLQPVHNVFLLITSELGIPLMFFTLLIAWRFIRAHRTLLPLVLFIVVTALGDHYWYTLHQNILLISVLFGVVVQKERA